MTFSDGMSLSAAAVALTSLLWNIARDFNDKGKLLLSAKLGKFKPSVDGKIYVFSGKEAEKATGKYALVIFMANNGKRPILVEKWFVVTRKRWKNEMHLVFPYKLPYKLNETELHSEFTYELDTIRFPIKNIVVLDSVGKKWFVRKQQIDEINKNYLNIQKTIKTE